MKLEIYFYNYSQVFFLLNIKFIDIFKPHQNLIKKGEYNNPDEFGIQSPNPSQVQRQKAMYLPMPLVVKDRRVLLNNRPILFCTYELIPKAQSLASNGPMYLSLSLSIYIYIYTYYGDGILQCLYTIMRE